MGMRKLERIWDGRGRGPLEPLRWAAKQRHAGWGVMSRTPVRVWNWRDAVLLTLPPLIRSPTTPLTRASAVCRRSVLMCDTGLSNHSVATHIKNAADAGPLVVERRTRRGGRFGLY